MASYCTSTNFAATFHIYSLSLWQKQGNVIDLSLSQGTFLASMAVPGTWIYYFCFKEPSIFLLPYPLFISCEHDCYSYLQMTVCRCRWPEGDMVISIFVACLVLFICYYTLTLNIYLKFQYPIFLFLIH